MPSPALMDPPSSDTGANQALIANRLGVSISTVSRALSDRPGINSATRSRILEVAAHMGYATPSFRANKAAGTRNLLMLSHGGGSEGDLECRFGLSQASLDMDISLFSHHYETDKCAQVLDPRLQPPALRSGLVNGIILVNQWPEALVAQLRKRWPIISIGHEYPLAGVDWVGLDDRQCMRLLAQHLVAQGHRRIGFFGHCPSVGWSRARYFAFLEAMARLELVTEASDVVAVPHDPANQFNLNEMNNAVDHVAARLSAGVTAWIGAGVMSANSLSRSLLARGLKIPRDVAIAGYPASNLPVAGLPKLTTAQGVEFDIGATVLQRLMWRMDHPSESGRAILLPAKLFPGETS